MNKHKHFKCAKVRMTWLVCNAISDEYCFIPSILKKYKSKIMIIRKNRSQEDTLNKLEKEPLRDYKTAFCSPLAHRVLQKKICKDLAMF
jgi:hypothetical protein